jgi:hypothetical protein
MRVFERFPTIHLPTTTAAFFFYQFLLPISTKETTGGGLTLANTELRTSVAADQANPTGRSCTTPVRSWGSSSGTADRLQRVFQHDCVVGEQGGHRGTAPPWEEAWAFHEAVSNQDARAGVPSNVSGIPRGAHKWRSYSGYQKRRGRDDAPATIRSQAQTECTMERYENDVQRDDEQSAAIVKAMIGAVAAMTLIVMMTTVLVFQSGGSILA